MKTQKCGFLKEAEGTSCMAKKDDCPKSRLKCRVSNYCYRVAAISEGKP